METDIQRLLDTFADLRKKANANACFGEPMTVKGRTVVPVARVGYGLTMEAGKGPTTEAGDEAPGTAMGAGGGAGGMMSSPLGVIEVTSEGTRVEPIVDGRMVAIVAMVVGAWSVLWIARALDAIFGGKD